MSQPLSAQSSDIAELKAIVLDLKKVVTAKIDEVNLTISSEVKRLEEKLTEDIEELRNADQRVIDTFIEFRKETADDVNALKTELEDTKAKLLVQTDNLQVVTGQVLAQQKKIVSLEKECHRGLQHGRGFNIEIDGIPKNVGDNPIQLEEAALKIFEAINLDIQQYDIDTIHRLPSKKEPKVTIVRFVSRKSVRLIHQNKKKLKDLKDLHLDIPGITEESRIFIRASQCSYYKNLAYNCRVLKGAKRLSKVLTGKDGRITILLNDLKTYVQVNHESVLTTQFPDFRQFDFNYDDYEDAENE